MTFLNLLSQYVYLAKEIVHRYQKKKRKKMKQTKKGKKEKEDYPIIFLLLLALLNCSMLNFWYVYFDNFALDHHEQLFIFFKVRKR